MQLKLIIALVVLIAIVLIAGIWWFGFQDSGLVREAPLRQSSPPTPEATAGRSAQQAPQFALENYDGETVRLNDFQGKPVVINAWAVWCPFCVKELSDFATVQKEFGDRVVFIAIDRAESREAAKGFTDQLGITDDLVFLLDPADSFYQAISGFSMPETLFVKADGTIQFHKRGPMPVEEIRQRTQALVQ